MNNIFETRTLEEISSKKHVLKEEYKIIREDAYNLVNN